MSESENSYKSSERSFVTNKKNIDEIIDNKNMVCFKDNKKILSKSVIVKSKDDKNSKYIAIEINNKSNNINNNNENDLISSKGNNSNSSYSKKNKRYHLPLLEVLSLKNSRKSYLNNSEKYEEESIKQIYEKCLICEEKLTNDELKNNIVECFHGFCNDCYYEYFKEKINNNEIEKIKCPQKDCNQIIYIIL